MYQIPDPVRRLKTLLTLGHSEDTIFVEFGGEKVSACCQSALCLCLSVCRFFFFFLNSIRRLLHSYVPGLQIVAQSVDGHDCTLNHERDLDDMITQNDTVV